MPTALPFKSFCLNSLLMLPCITLWLVIALRNVRCLGAIWLLLWFLLSWFRCFSVTGFLLGNKTTFTHDILCSIFWSNFRCLSSWIRSHLPNGFQIVDVFGSQPPNFLSINIRNTGWLRLLYFYMFRSCLLFKWWLLGILSRWLSS